jgi:hypothetical protein
MAPNSPKTIIMPSAITAAQFLHGSCHNYPDITWRIKDSHIIQSPHCAESQITASFEMKATRVYRTVFWSEVVYCAENDHHDPLFATCQPTFSVETESLSGARGVMRGYSAEQTQTALDATRLMTRPMSLRLTGSVLMRLDGDRRVTHFELNTTCIENTC